MEIWLCFSVIGMFVAGMIAHSKNRNAFGWGAIGFLMPLIAVILAIVLPPNETRSDAS
jgi:hypothetical protein